MEQCWPNRGEESQGYAVLDEAQVGELIESVGMKPGHAAKLRSFLNGELSS